MSEEHEIEVRFLSLPPSSCYNKREYICGSSSVGRASPCQGEGRGSESRLPLTTLLARPRPHSKNMNLIQYLTPTNLAQEKERFFASKSYNPQLEYRWQEPEVREWVREKEDLQSLFAALNTQNADEVQQVASEYFDTALIPSFLEEAKRITSHVPERLPAQPIQNVVTAFKEAFSFFGLAEHSVEILDQHGFNFRPVSQEKKIVVSRYLNLDFFSIDGEVKHEMVHILRYENGKTNGIPPALDYLPTEEGLATYCQDYTGQHGESSLFQHAAEYSMTEVSLQSSLRDTITYLQDLGFSPELAWQRAIRHKFGFRDTSLPGDIMKPSMYFYHQQKIKALSQEEKYRLFVGKIARRQLPEYEKYDGKISLEKLQEFYTFPEEENDK